MQGRQIIPKELYSLCLLLLEEKSQEVLTKLKKESLRRKIKIISYGPCTVEVAQVKLA
jgi:hypothetical protein